MSTIPKIKEALRLHIELATKATPGEWERYGGDDEGTDLCAKHNGQLFVICKFPHCDEEHQQCLDARFIAHARQFSPAAAKALLAVIGHLECVVAAANYHGEREVANAALATIVNQWPEGA